VLSGFIRAQSPAAAAQFRAMPRTSSFAAWLLTVVVLVTGVVWGLDVVHQRKPKLSYQGRALEYWFNQLPMTSINGKTVGQSRHMLMRSASGAVRKYGDWMETPEASAQAIRGIGTNALTFYFGKLTRHYGPVERAIPKVAHAVGYHGFLLADVDPERRQAVTALILLKPLLPEVVSELVTLSTNSHREIAAAARCALTTEENELVLLHPPASQHSLDIDLLNLPILRDFK
jgi:hypothetical protein